MPRNIPRDPAETAPPLRLLFVDDDADDLELCLRGLRKSGLDFQAVSVSTREDFSSALEENTFDIVVSDFRMKGWTGIDALAMVNQVCPGVPVILLSGTLGEELAVDCIKMGVTDYVLKHQLARLPIALKRAREERSLREGEKKAVAALRESEERYRTLVENAPEAIVVFDADLGRFIDCNDNALRLFRVTRDELMRHGPADLSPAMQPDGRPSELSASEHVSDTLNGGTPCFEWMHRNSQGDEIPCEIHLVGLPSPARRLVRGSILNIAERKRAEVALRESESRYRGLVNNATYGIYWVTTEGKLLFVNPALVQILGYDSAEDLLAVPNTKAFYVNPSDRDALLAKYRKEGRVESKAAWKRKDGKAITVRVNARWARVPGYSDHCFEVMVEDITDRIALEKQLLEAQKFEAIGQLAGGIAHDFNNMIGAIIGWADIGADETEVDSRLRRHFEKVRQQAERAAALTRQLLAFARRQILAPRDIDMNQSVVETLSLLEKVIGSNIEIKANLASDLAVVRADSTQLEQVILNLCINARDAMPDGGSLKIETANVTFDEQSCAQWPLAHPGKYAMLSVADTGTGMDAATLGRIFEPFFTTKELGKGTGLGLATVYGIARQHDGFVEVTSELHVGSTFRVYLPVSASLVISNVSPDDRSLIRGGNETILVAEDHDGLREIALEILTSLGYRVVLAADGEQALREFQSLRDLIDLALLDVMLPKISGPEIYARISRERPGLPVIFATGYSADSSLLRQVEERDLPVIQKPYSPQDLARKVREVLDGRRQALPYASIRVDQ
jgi:two-component system, cell cycle sensor histidine kinase and response regulator CckA